MPENIRLKIAIPPSISHFEIFDNLEDINEILETTFGAKVSIQETSILIKVDEEYKRLVRKFFDKFLQKKIDKESVEKIDLIQIVDMVTRKSSPESKDEGSTDLSEVEIKKKRVKAQTAGQSRLIDTIDKNVITFSLGVAGTGKTFLSVAKAVEALEKQEVSRIVLTRPAVEAGERLGFLPGDLQAKIDPYLRPLYDSLFELMGGEEVTKLQEKGIIEIAPLAYMRGRTLNKAFVILDEAQNTTPAQMKMFLTRCGFGSKMVVNGDPTQIDLPKDMTSGLLESQRLLQNIPDIGFANLTREDVVRHTVVQRIIDAYEKN